MRGKCFVCMLVSLLFVQLSFCSVKDSNVVIQSGREVHEFVWQKSKNTVQVKQTVTTTYYCKYFAATLPIREFCNDQVSIDNIQVIINHKEVQQIKPQYTSYDSEGEFLTDARLCFFDLPFTAKEITGTVGFQKTIRDARYFTTVYFSEPYPVIHKEVCIKVPRWMKADLVEMNFSNCNITKTVFYNREENADLYTYTINNLPPVSSESNSPGPSYTEPHLLVLVKEADVNGKKLTFLNTVADQYAWYRQLAGNTADNDSSIKAMALRLTSSLQNDLDKIKAVFYWVQHNIRYIAYENGIAGFRPDKAAEVVRKRYGDCKGMANLTKELLKSIGYDTRLCWIGTNHIAYNYSTPSLAVDDHMICALFWNGNRYFLDATEPYLPFNEYAERIQGRQCLIEDGDNYVLTNIPATTNLQNRDEEKRSLSLQGTNMEGSTTRVWKGEEKEKILYNLGETRKDISNDVFQRYVTHGNADCIITGFQTSGLHNLDEDLVASYHVLLTNAAASFGSDYYLNIDSDKKFNNFLFDPAGRKQDYWFNNKMFLYRQTALAIPAGYTLKSKLPSLEIKNDRYEFLISCSLLADTIVYKKTIVIKDIKLSRDQFAQWNADIRQLTAAYNKQIVLTAKQNQ